VAAFSVGVVPRQISGASVRPEPALPGGRHARAGHPAAHPAVGGAATKGRAPVPSRGTGRRPRPGGV